MTGKAINGLAAVVFGLGVGGSVSSFLAGLLAAVGFAAATLFLFEGLNSGDRNDAN